MRVSKLVRWATGAGVHCRPLGSRNRPDARDGYQPPVPDGFARMDA